MQVLVRGIAERFLKFEILKFLWHFFLLNTWQQRNIIHEIFRSTSNPLCLDRSRLSYDSIGKALPLLEGCVAMSVIYSTDSFYTTVLCMGWWGSAGMLSDASEIIYILSLDAYRDEPVCITCMSTLRSTSRSLTWIGELIIHATAWWRMRYFVKLTHLRVHMKGWCFSLWNSVHGLG